MPAEAMDRESVPPSWVGPLFVAQRDRMESYYVAPTDWYDYREEIMTLLEHDDQAASCACPRRTTTAAPS